MSQDMIIILVVVVFIVLVVLLMSKGKSDTTSDDGKDPSAGEPSAPSPDPSNADDPFHSAVSSQATEETPVSDSSGSDDDPSNPFKAPS